MPERPEEVTRSPRLGLGLAALGRPGYINLGHASDLERDYDPQVMQSRAFEVLDAAHAGGIRHFDAARSYGLAETFLALWLTARGVGRSDVVVSSKWGYTYTAQWQVQAAQHEVKDHSLAAFERQWPESKALLGAWLRLYLVHSVTPESPLLTDAATLERLVRLRDLGIMPGLSVSGPHQAEVIERALMLTVDGQPVFGAVQATYNLLEQSAGPMLRAAHAAGWSVYVKEALANGRLTARAASLPAELTDLSQQRALTPDALALAFVLVQPFADVVLSGATTPAHLHSNLSAEQVQLGGTETALLAQAAESPQTYWQTRSNLRWN
ncbi:aldo/keto reductase (plasmid) [Deinococcus sp. KNUC1210]|uniref:aldo/keto reductase n=1 Tax=Deinococcus sp. KNUC1210 TaxID=2917691 RepID=UPI001EF0F85F|nr:aldo/keto reductase [Deinococcus sp. KNUC1210]ULH14111.1 aldo/keto reductase [Deinococcus sp. KNUC1210]